MQQLPPILPIILLKLERFYGDKYPAAMNDINEVGSSQRIPPKLSVGDVPDAGADRLRLFAGIDPVAAVPSRAVHVLGRLLRGEQAADVHVNYEIGQQALDSQLPRNFAARQRAYFLLQQHAELVCRHDQPHCNGCPVNLNCVYFSEQGNTTGSG